MKFEQEILRDYQKLIAYAKFIKKRYKHRLKLNIATSEDSDFVNDAIVDFYNDPPQEYDIKLLERGIQRHMSKEDKILTNQVSFENAELFNPSSIKKQESSRNISSPLTRYSEKIINSEPISKSDECNYFLLNDGRCISHMISNNRFRIVKPLVRSDGYLQYNLPSLVDYVHRMVYKKYGGVIPNDMEVHHIDHDKSNCHIDNLMLTSHSDNLLFYHSTYCKLDKPKRSTKLGAPFGVNHGKFKGYYIINGIRYESSYHAQKETGINYRTLQRYCKNNKPGFSFVTA